jgi:Fic family protein
MSYIETNPKEYTYFVKKISFLGKQKTIKEYMGKKTHFISKEEFLLKNIEKITKKELEFKKNFFKLISNISYKDFEKTEKNSILINNLIESKKKNKEIEKIFAEEFIFNSNNIEGSRIPKEKVKEMIETGKTKYSNYNEVKEVINSIKSFEFIKKDFKFNEISIKRLYYILTENLLQENGRPYPNGYKKNEIIVGNSKTTSPENVKKEINELLERYKKNKKKEHPLQQAFDFHLNYESIHPFENGNGRTGRLIMNKILMANGYFPIIIFKENRKAYFNSIKKGREGKYKKYYSFMHEQMNKSYDYILSKI